MNQKLLDVIQRANWSIRGLPSSARLDSDVIDVKETLRLCRAGITIYADRAKFATAYNRLMYFLNQIVEASLPLVRWAVYLEQGTVATEFGIVSNEVVSVDERSFAQFLHGL